MKKYVFQEYLNMIGENIVNTKLKPGISGTEKIKGSLLGH